VASVLGSPGQANHSAANAGMDSLMHSRRTRGLAGCSINWGAWSGVGAAVRHDVGQRIAQQGVGMIDVEGGLAAFEAVLAAGVRQAVVVPMDWARYGAQFATRQPPPLLADLLVKRKTAAPTATAVEPASLQRQLEQTPEDGRPRVVLDFVRTQAWRILGLPAAHPLGVRQPLNELGLDSLMAVELRNSLASSLGRQMPATLLFDYPTVEALSRYLQDELLGRQVVTAPQPEVSVERIAQMSEDEVERQLAARMAKGRKP
jgi:polyketide synthase 12/myxalamid-type polyketide synthase MxaB